MILLFGIMSGKKLEMVFEWFSDAYWHWRNVFYFRFGEYNDDIDRLAFFEELCYGWIQMRDEHLMFQPNFDPYNLRGRS
jgi:hypothetical protein